jgi:Zn-dependent metalloprotease
MKRLDPSKCRSVPGRDFGSPKELWGFRTVPDARRPLAIARDFLDANAPLLAIEGLTAKFGAPRLIESLGARHVILQQRHRGLRVHRAYVTLHLDSRGRVYLVKNRAVPRDRLPGEPEFRVSEARAVGIAKRHISSSARRLRPTKPERVWFWAKSVLHPAWKIRVHRMNPRCEWIVYVDAERGTLLHRWDNLALAPIKRCARIFDPNPVVGAPKWRPLDENGTPRVPPAEAYRTVRLRDLTSPRVLDGRRVSTRLTSKRIRTSGPVVDTLSTKRGFDEAMAYYHVNRAIAYLESLGYRGRRRLFTKPIDIDAHGTRDDNSWYSPDGRSLTFGTGGVDDAEDAEVILHEFGHAIQDAICPDFGQSEEAAAMGEGFGDYFAASFFAAKKPARFRDSVMSWDGVENDELDPPCQRRMDGAWTYENFDHGPKADEHVNGTIWSAALWDIWKALGRAAADRIILESHFQLDGFTTFARGARAIIDADRNLCRGVHGGGLLEIFHRRGIGPVE